MDIDEFDEKLKESGNEEEKKKYRIETTRSSNVHDLWLANIVKVIFLIAIPVLIALKGYAVEMVTFFAVVIAAYEFTFRERKRKENDSEYELEHHNLDQSKIRDEYDYSNYF